MLGVVIPGFNILQYLPRIAQVTNELTAAGVECLLVDDCSTDNTYNQARSLGLPMVRTPCNLGPGGARNYGVQRLTSEWVHFLDADDLISVDVLLNSLGYLDTSLDVLLVGAQWVDERTGKPLKEWRIEPEDITCNSLLYSLASPIPACCSIIRVSLFRTIGGFDTELRCWEDGDLHLRLAAYGARFGVGEGILTTAMRHDRGASSNHLYCHQCRLAYLKRYAALRLPIDPAALAGELLQIGYLLIGERKYRDAFQAFQLAQRLHSSRPNSKQPLVRFIMRLLPPAWSWFLQYWLRQTLGRYVIMKK